MRAASSLVDPFLPTPFALSQKPQIYPGPRAIRPSRIAAGEATGVFIMAGQSNCANFGDTPYTPTNSAKVDNLNIYDGGTYAATDPLLGCNTGGGGNWGGRFADKLIAAGKYARVILIPVAIGGTTVAQWAPGGNLNALVTVAFLRCAAVGMPVTAVLWQQGENDGTGGTTQAAYQTSLTALIAQQRAAGNTAPWLIGTSTLDAGTVYPTIQAACAAMPNGSYIFAGANTDTLTGSTYRQADLTHFNATGDDNAATLWKSAWVATGL